MLIPKFTYLNFDSDEDRLRIMRKNWSPESALLILDEIHKMRFWKRWIKGIYDTKPSHLQILVTGSSKLDISKKMGDSLAGRHFNYRLYPFDLSELKWASHPTPIEELFEFGNFPEPYLQRSREFYTKWRRSHQDLIIRQDLLSFESIRDISSIETLILLLRERVGSPISYASLARDLQRDPTTIKRWLGILESLYIIFKIVPYSKNIARSILKEPKYYFYDSAMPTGESSAKLENLIAFSLLKKCHYLEDCLGKTASLHYLKSKDKIEVDFFLQIEGQEPELIEVKWADPHLSEQLFHFRKFFPKAKLYQVSFKLERSVIEFPHGKVFRAQEWLENL
jgi:predicted AAA+ superfamily ATPase